MKKSEWCKVMDCGKTHSNGCREGDVVELCFRLETENKKLFNILKDITKRFEERTSLIPDLQAENKRLGDIATEYEHIIDKYHMALEKINKMQIPKLDKDMATAQLGGLLAVCFGIAREALGTEEL